MQIPFYDTRITDDFNTILEKEKSVYCGVKILDSPKLIAEMLNEVVSLNVLGEEHCYMLALNTKSIVIGIFLISKGTVNQCVIGTREIFIRALLIGASQIVFCHNHPSTECTPSKEDILFTKKLSEVGKLLGIQVSDHIIVGGNNFYSFYEHELL